jgi:hypothetical protein
MIGGLIFFAGRKWVDRGTRYLRTAENEDDDTDSSITTDSSPNDQERVDLELALQTELAEVDAAYSPERLQAIVADMLGGEKIRMQQPTSNNRKEWDLDLETVDHYCDLAEKGDTVGKHCPYRPTLYPVKKAKRRHGGTPLLFWEGLVEELLLLLLLVIWYSMPLCLRYSTKGIQPCAARQVMH